MASPARSRTFSTSRWPKGFQVSQQASFAPTTDFAICPKLYAQLSHRKCSSALQVGLLLHVMGMTWSSPVDEFGQPRGKQPDESVNTNPGPEWSAPIIDADLAKALNCPLRTLQWVKADAIKREILAAKPCPGTRGLCYKTNAEMLAAARDYSSELEPDPTKQAGDEGKAKPSRPAPDRLVLKAGERARPMPLSSAITRISCGNPSSLPIALSFQASANGTLRVAIRAAADDAELRNMLRGFATSSPHVEDVPKAPDGRVTPQHVAELLEAGVANKEVTFCGELRKLYEKWFAGRAMEQFPNVLGLVRRELGSDDLRLIPYLHDRLAEKRNAQYPVVPLLLPHLARDFRLDEEAAASIAATPQPAPTDRWGRPITPADPRAGAIETVVAMIQLLALPDDGLNTSQRADIQRDLDNAPADIKAAAMERVSRA